MSTNLGYHWKTGEETTPARATYETDGRCDTCKRLTPGVMYHARGATGRICPVLFLCHRCGNSRPGTYRKG